MCQPLSKGGRRCPSDAQKRLDRLSAEWEELHSELRELTTIRLYPPYMKHPLDYSENSKEKQARIDSLREELRRNQKETEVARLDYDGTPTRQKELEEEIEKARAAGDEKEVKRLSRLSYQASVHVAQFAEKNIREYEEEQRKKEDEQRRKEAEENYLPEVYRKFMNFNEPIPPASYTSEHIARLKKKATDKKLSPERRAAIQERIPVIENASTFYQNWIKDNYNGKKVTQEDIERANQAVYVAEKDHGEGSPQAEAAKKNAIIVRNCAVYQNAIETEEHIKIARITSINREIERQQVAIKEGRFLSDAKFVNDEARQTSPYGVEWRDVTNARVEVKSVRKIFGEDSPQFAKAKKHEHRVSGAYQSRREIRILERMRRVIGQTGSVPTGSTVDRYAKYTSSDRMRRTV